MTTNQPVLPGMEPGPGKPTALEKAAETTIDYLRRSNAVTDKDELTCQLIRELARMVGRGAATGRGVTAAAMAARQLIDAIALLPDPPAGENDEWAKLVQEMQNAAG